MKKGLMVQFPYGRGRQYVCKNIGDYVQAVATKQFIDSIDEYIEQEEANNYYPIDHKPIRLIMNGWFQWRSKNWPPSEFIYPLLISMHISPLKAKDLLSRQGVEFLKKWGPVGCRDYYTMELLEEHGVPAYFSACMTLTLGKNYSVPEEKKKGVYFVDPYFEIPKLFERGCRKKLNVCNALKAIFAIIFHIRTVRKLSKNEFFKDYSPTGFLDRDRSRFRRLYKAAMFYKTYKTKFDRKLLLNASYVTHWMDVKMDGTVDNKDLLNIAEDLVKQYAAAKMVVTSRIHAGLPCLGVGTPVVFIANEEVLSEQGTFNTPGRLGGLIDLFRALTLNGGIFISEDEVFRRIDIFKEDTVFQNKDDWRQYAEKLAESASSFMDDECK